MKVSQIISAAVAVSQSYAVVVDEHEVLESLDAIDQQVKALRTAVTKAKAVPVVIDTRKVSNWAYKLRDYFFDTSVNFTKLLKDSVYRGEITYSKENDEDPFSEEIADYDRAAKHFLEDHYARLVELDMDFFLGCYSSSPECYRKTDEIAGYLKKTLTRN